MGDFRAFYHALYPITVRFSRTFISGNLAGLTVADEVHFPDTASAQRWIAGVKDHPEIKSAKVVA